STKSGSAAVRSSSAAPAWISTPRPERCGAQLESTTITARRPVFATVRSFQAKRTIVARNSPSCASIQGEMTITILGIDHLVLRTRDVAALLRFYCDGLGCTVEMRRDDLGLVHVRAGRSMIDLVDVNGPLGLAGGAAPGAEGRNLDHFALRVETFDAEK